VDPHFVPLGVPLWLDTNDPDGIRLQRLVLAQDIGTAIKGAVRGTSIGAAASKPSTRPVG
jgi:membrane-bound lytic murein transglycosylase A